MKFGRCADSARFMLSMIANGQRSNRVPLMLISMIHVEVKKNKRDEFLKTLMALKKRFNQTSGCIAYHLGRDLENENLFHLTGEWRTQQDYDKHANSPEFEVLQGAIRILGLTSQVRILKLDEEV